MTKEQNMMILEDYFLDEDIDYKKDNDSLFIHSNREKTKLPDTMIQADCFNDIIVCSVFPRKYTVPKDKLQDIGLYFRMINVGLMIGEFDLVNENVVIMDDEGKDASIFPAFKIRFDTIDCVPSKKRIRQILNILLSTYDQYIDGVLMIHHDIFTPIQAAKAFIEREGFM